MEAPPWFGVWGQWYCDSCQNVSHCQQKIASYIDPSCKTIWKLSDWQWLHLTAWQWFYTHNCILSVIDWPPHTMLVIIKCSSRSLENYSRNLHEKLTKKACLREFMLCWRIKAVIPNFIRIVRTVFTLHVAFSFMFAHFNESMHLFHIFLEKHIEMRGGSMRGALYHKILS